MIIACDRVAAGTELVAIADVVVVTMASLLVLGVEDDVYSVYVSGKASVTSWPSYLVRIFLDFMQIVYDLTVQLRRLRGQHGFLGALT